MPVTSDIGIHVSTCLLTAFTCFGVGLFPFFFFRTEVLFIYFRFKCLIRFMVCKYFLKNLLHHRCLFS